MRIETGAFVKDVEEDDDNLDFKTTFENNPNELTVYRHKDEKTMYEKQSEKF